MVAQGNDFSPIRLCQKGLLLLGSFSSVHPRAGRSQNSVPGKSGVLVFRCSLGEKVKEGWCRSWAGPETVFQESLAFWCSGVPVFQGCSLCRACRIYRLCHLSRCAYVAYLVWLGFRWDHFLSTSGCVMQFHPFELRPLFSYTDPSETQQQEPKNDHTWTRHGPKAAQND